MVSAHSLGVTIETEEKRQQRSNRKKQKNSTRLMTSNDVMRSIYLYSLKAIQLCIMYACLRLG